MCHIITSSHACHVPDRRPDNEIMLRCGDVTHVVMLRDDVTIWSSDTHSDAATQGWVVT